MWLQLQYLSVSSGYNIEFIENIFIVFSVVAAIGTFGMSRKAGKKQADWMKNIQKRVGAFSSFKVHE